MPQPSGSARFSPIFQPDLPDRQNSEFPVQSLRKKYFCFSEAQISRMVQASRLAQRGVTADRHETWGGMRWTPMCTDERHRGVRRNRVVLTPRRWRQVGG